MSSLYVQPSDQMPAVFEIEHALYGRNDAQPFNLAEYRRWLETRVGLAKQAHDIALANGFWDEVTDVDSLRRHKRKQVVHAGIEVAELNNAIRKGSSVQTILEEGADARIVFEDLAGGTGIIALFQYRRMVFDSDADITLAQTWLDAAYASFFNAFYVHGIVSPELWREVDKAIDAILARYADNDDALVFEVHTAKLERNRARGYRYGLAK